jgi:hypothetical protein
MIWQSGGATTLIEESDRYRDVKINGITITIDRINHHDDGNWGKLLILHLRQELIIWF